MQKPSLSPCECDPPTFDTEGIPTEFSERTPRRSNPSTLTSIQQIPVSPHTRKFPSFLHSYIHHELKQLTQHTGATAQAQLSLLLLDYAREDMSEALLDLITKGYEGATADVNFRDSHGKTPLHTAAETGQLRACQAILDYGKIKDLNLEDAAGLTPLALACKNGHGHIMRLLLRSGAKLNIQDHEGNSPLHYIVKARSTEMFSYLLRRDADLTLRNKEGLTPVELAKSSRFNDQVCVMNVVQPACRPLCKTLEEESVEFDDSFEEESSSGAQSVQSASAGEGDTDLFDFEMLRPIKKVSYGEILYLVRHLKSERLYTMKVIKKAKLTGRTLYMKYALTEKKVLTVVKHPFITELKYTFQSETFLYLIIDHCRGGDLARYLKRNLLFSEDQARVYCAEAVLALEALHSQDIIYRNLKPSNVELDHSGHIKLTNFGLAKEKVADHRAANSFFMSFSHVAPEIIKSEGHGKPADWYMLGVFLYELLTGLPPFANPNKNQFIEDIKSCELPLPTHWAPATASFLRALLAKDPADRLGSLRGAEDVKSHAFFAGVFWSSTMCHQSSLAPPPQLEDISVCSINDSFFSRNSSVISSAEPSRVHGWTFISNC